MLVPRKSCRAVVSLPLRGFVDGVSRSSRRAFDEGPPSRGAPSLVVLRGLSGAGKTAVLRALAARGEQVLDLEALAVHRGSAFGRVGLTKPQPSNRAFAASVSSVLADADPSRALWVEEEGDYLGRLAVPARFADAAGIDLHAPFSQRVARIAGEYADVSRADLVAAIGRCAPRLGERAAQDAATRVEQDDLAAAVTVLLPFYDRAYAHRAAQAAKRKPPFASIDVGGLDPESIAGALVDVLGGRGR